MRLDRIGGTATRLDRITAAARTDRASRKAHLAALRDRHGRDWRKVIAVGLLVVAALWLAALVALRVPLG